MKFQTYVRKDGHKTNDWFFIQPFKKMLAPSPWKTKMMAFKQNHKIPSNSSVFVMFCLYILLGLDTGLSCLQYLSSKIVHIHNPFVRTLVSLNRLCIMPGWISHISSNFIILLDGLIKSFSGSLESKDGIKAESITTRRSRPHWYHNLHRIAQPLKKKMIIITLDKWNFHLTPDTWHITYDTW